jgi:HlyD family secretion protein
MKRSAKRLVTAAFLLLAAAALVYAFLPGPVPVDLAPVTRGPLRVTVDEDGKTRIKERYVVSAPLAGRMLRIDLHPGDKVSAGKTLLAALEPTDPALLDVRARAEAEARVKAAEASRTLAEAKLGRAREARELAAHDFGRTKRLITSRSVSEEAYEGAEHRDRMAEEELRTADFSARVAAFELEQARAALLRTRPSGAPATGDGRFEIHSPVAGEVLRVFQESAGVVPAGTRLLEVGDPADLEVEVDVLSNDAVKVAPGARVLLEHWGGERPLQGRVRLVEPSGFLKISALGVEEQRVNVIVDLVGPPEERRRLGDAYRVEARIVVWEGESVVKAPAGALFRQGDEWAAFVAERGRVRLRTVHPGRSNGLETEIANGLAEGEQVVLHPGDRVVDGVAVRPR